jgi:hypothetical protein
MNLRFATLLLCLMGQMAAATAPVAASHGNASAGQAMEHCAGHAAADTGAGMHEHNGHDCTPDCQMCIAAVFAFALTSDLVPVHPHARYAVTAEAFLPPEISDLPFRPPIAS